MEQGRNPLGTSGHGVGTVFSFLVGMGTVLGLLATSHRTLPISHVLALVELTVDTIIKSQSAIYLVEDCPMQNSHFLFRLEIG